MYLHTTIKPASILRLQIRFSLEIVRNEHNEPIAINRSIPNLLVATKIFEIGNSTKAGIGDRKTATVEVSRI